MLLAAATAVLLLHARHYLPFISDDALISLRYADRLLAGAGLTWTDGHPVEGYSNLLWVLLVALVGLTGVDLVQAARGLGLACTVGAMAALACHYGRQSRGPAMAAIAIALGFLSLAAPIGVWSIGGLEQPLVAALLATATALLLSTVDTATDDRRTSVALGITLGLLCLTRPDGPIFTAASVGTLAITAVRSKSSGWWTRILIVGGIPILFTIAQLIFRLAYYGELVPNTALVKVTPSTDRWFQGWRYLVNGLKALFPFAWLSLAALIATLMSARVRNRGVALAALFGAWSAYVVFIGGDIFPAYRHMVPIVVVCAFALAEGTLLARDRLAHRPLIFAILAGAGLLLLVPFGSLQVSDPQSQRAVRERWEWDCRKLALLLKEAFEPQQPLVAVTAAGCLPFWSELPSLDMLGLNDHYLPRHPPPDFGSGMIGHELGDGAYVLSRQPDIIVFNVGSGPQYRSGEEMARMATFQEEYVPVLLGLTGVEYPPVVYVRQNSPKVGIGVTRSEANMSIPGFLLTGPGTSAVLSDSGALEARLEPGASANLTIPGVGAPAAWVADARPSVTGLTIGVRHEKDTIVVTARSTAGQPVSVRQVLVTRP